ncbi:MAG: hypothetical protein DMD35_04345 [Gemmatimonadetes bacterium]|nr:MAG: hypothetical protein DMD35_04345 [Gemmatimonadota bacterium]
MVLGAGLMLLAAVGARAQSATSPCPAGASATDPARLTQDACQIAVDVFDVMAPQLGLALSGGNATLGQGGNLGGPGHFSIGLRGNVFNGDLPQVTSFPNPSLTGRLQRTGSQALPSKSQILGLPTADAALGIFRGVPLGLTSVGGIDLLLSATYVPSFGGAGDEIQIKPERNLQVGYGVRIGLLQESIAVPGVSFTYLKRDLPTTSIIGTASSFTIDIADAKVKTSAFRLVASKSLLLLGLAGGVGQDRYDESALVRATSGAASSTVVPFAEKLTRTNYFLDVSLNLPVFKLIGEVGQVSGGTVDTYNEFTTGRADKSRTYGSVGIRIGL